MGVHSSFFNVICGDVTCLREGEPVRSWRSKSFHEMTGILWIVLEFEWQMGRTKGIQNPRGGRGEKELKALVKMMSCPFKSSMR